MIKDAFISTLTGKDNKTYDIARIGMALGALTTIGLQTYVTLTTGVFNPLEFASGYSAVLFGGGAAIAFKANTEPDPSE